MPFSLVNAIGTAFQAYKKATLVQQFKDSYLEDRKRQFDALFLEKFNASTYNVLSSVNNWYNAIRDEAHSFALPFREETETTLPTLNKSKSSAKVEEIMTLWTRHTNNISKKFCLWTLAWYKRTWLRSCKTWAMHIGWSHLFSTQAALTKTQCTDLDYKHASSVSVAWIQLDQEAPKPLRDFCGFWIRHTVMQIAEL